jgi:hypothetical protein
MAPFSQWMGAFEAPRGDQLACPRFIHADEFWSDVFGRNFLFIIGNTVHDDDDIEYSNGQFAGVHRAGMEHDLLKLLQFLGNGAYLIVRREELVHPCAMC